MTQPPLVRIFAYDAPWRDSPAYRCIMVIYGGEPGARTQVYIAYSFEPYEGFGF